MLLCEKLGYCLSELREKITLEELILWQNFWEIRSEEEQKAMDKAKRQRR